MLQFMLVAVCLVQADVLDSTAEASPQHDTESLQANKL